MKVGLRKLRYREQDTRHWLRWLARAMRASGHSEFHLEQLQPSWLRWREQRLVYVLLSRILQGLAVGILFTSIFAAMETEGFVRPSADSDQGAGPAAAGDAGPPRGQELAATSAPLGGATAATTANHWRRRLTHLYWGLICGVALGGFDYFRLGNRGIWAWLNFPVFPRQLSVGVSQLARRWLLRATPLAEWLSRRVSAAKQLPDLLREKAEATDGVLEHAVQYLLAWLTNWFVAGVAVSVFVLPTLATNPDGSSPDPRLLLPLFVLIFGFISSKAVGRVWSNDIVCVETLGQSWGHATVGALLGAFGGGCVALVYGHWAVIVLVGLIMGAAFHGLKTSVQAIKARPNQGILLSAKHAVTYGLGLGLLCGFLWGYSIWIEQHRGKQELRPLLWYAVIGAAAAVFGRSLLRSLIRRQLPHRRPRRIRNRSLIYCGALGGLCLGLLVHWRDEPLILWSTACAVSALTLTSAIWFGGLELIRHQTLRTILYVSDYTPLRYVHFLDYCARRLAFMEKVGGGYLFMHRYLLEHFSEMSEESVATRTDPIAGTRDVDEPAAGADAIAETRALVEGDVAGPRDVP